MQNKTPQTDITSQLNKLTGLLEKQLDCLRKSELNSFEKLTSQTEPLIKLIHKNQELMDKSKHGAKLGKIQKLYNTIILATHSQVQELSDRLKHLHKGRETLAKYQGFKEENA